MKKKQKKSVQNGLIKALRAQQQNKFNASIRSLCDLLAGPDVFLMLPKDFLETMFYVRFYEVKIELEEKHRGVKGLEEFVRMTKLMFDNGGVDLGNGKGELPFAVVFSDLYTLASHVYRLEDDQFPTAKEIKERLKEYLIRSPFYERAFNDIEKLTAVVGLLQTHLDEGWVRPVYTSQIPKGKSFCNQICIHLIEAEKKNLVVDGKSRPAIRLGWPIQKKGIDWVQIKPSVLGLSLRVGDEPMDVYIQDHALRRMNERLGIWEGLMHFSIFESLKRLQFQRGGHGEFLIEYRIYNDKVGYLAATVQNRVVIIRTFLFLTCQGTPEAKKLEELMGLEKMDLKYFRLDKLSSFTNKEFCENEKLRGLMTQVNCEHILHLGSLTRLSKGVESELDTRFLLDYLERSQKHIHSLTENFTSSSFLEEVCNEEALAV